MIEISVRDSGIGIKPEDHKKLFKLFGFLDNTKELNSKGVGLGLHISQMITEQFGGKIVLDSDIGCGATFTFVIDLDENVVGKSKNNR
jgi:signal transduction histidine kinase